MSELERIERRLIELEFQAGRLFQLQSRQFEILERIVTLLQEPVTYPASSGGSINVK